MPTPLRNVIVRLGSLDKPDHEQHDDRADRGMNDGADIAAADVNTERGSSQPATNAPTMPTTMLPIRPKPPPAMIWPASQPAIAPMMRKMISASGSMTSLHLRPLSISALARGRPLIRRLGMPLRR